MKSPLRFISFPFCSSNFTHFALVTIPWSPESEPTNQELRSLGGRLVAGFALMDKRG